MLIRDCKDRKKQRVEETKKKEKRKNSNESELKRKIERNMRMDKIVKTTAK